MTLTINCKSLLIAACWVIGIGLGVLDVIHGPDWAALSTAFIITGATVGIRDRHDRHAANWQQAYEVGREVSSVRKIR